MTADVKARVLFVCSGNICRSPTAEGVFRHQIAQAGLDGIFIADSCGTHGYHEGEPPDPRALDTARERGIDLGDLRARPLRLDDFERFDLLLAMDGGHYAHLERVAPRPSPEKIRLFLDFTDRTQMREVVDPYYGPRSGFDMMFDLIETGVEGLIETLRKQHA